MERDAIGEAYGAPASDTRDRKGKDEGEPIPELASAKPMGAPYVVSTGKLATLYLVTFAFYSLYWFYKQWKHQALVTSRKISPAWRGLWSFIYVFSLFNAIEDEARTTDGARPQRLNGEAALYLCLTLGSYAVESIDSHGFWGALAMLLGLVAVMPMVAAQKVVNITHGDEKGSANAKLSGGQTFVVLCSLVIWLIVCFGFFTQLMADTTGSK